MKKLTLKIAFVAAFAAIAGYVSYNSQKEEMNLSELALDNVEALASCEWNHWFGPYNYHITLTGYCSWTCTSGGVFQCPY